MVNLSTEDFYINRELSWLDFNHRVFEMSREAHLPVLERLKFLSIFYSNLDEFFMVRVGRVIERYMCGNDPIAPDGIRPTELLREIRMRVVDGCRAAESLWKKTLIPQLAKHGLSFKSFNRLSGAQKKFLTAYFKSEIAPLLAVRPFEGRVSADTVVSRDVNFIVALENAKKIDYVWFSLAPSIPKVLYIPRGRKCEKSYGDVGKAFPGTREDAICTQDVIRAFLPQFIKTKKILSCTAFRITRNTKLAIDEEEDDILRAVRDLLERRRYSEATRLEISYGTSRELYTVLKEAFRLPMFKIYRLRGPLAFCEMISVYGIERPDLKYKAFNATAPHLFSSPDLFERIRKEDQFLYHPYDNFSAVVSFIRHAAEDPAVTAISQTVYRVSSVSPVIDSLMQAKRNGKRVTVVVELKARFDEERNISWGEALSTVGVNVVYSPNDLKIHAKMCLVERLENGETVRYAHLASGNYNASTARLYCDLGLFTANRAICDDAKALFDVLTHSTPHPDYKALLVSPVGSRDGLLRLIDEEIELNRLYGDGAIDLKCNQLVDPTLIKALYRASREGVKVRLQVRGATSIRLGVEGVSENITLTSIVGRFLEHARIYRFNAHGKNTIYVGSADLMQRNLDRRIEVLFPVYDLKVANGIREILETHLRDNVQAWELKKNGEYRRLAPAKGEKAIDSQRLMMESAKNRFIKII